MGYIQSNQPTDSLIRREFSTLMNKLRVVQETLLAEILEAESAAQDKSLLVACPS
jgi:hypothetical protein